MRLDGGWLQLFEHNPPQTVVEFVGDYDAMEYFIQMMNDLSNEGD